MKTFLTFAFAFLLAFSASASAADSIGFVKTMSGETTIARTGVDEAPQVGAALYTGDVIRTGNDGSLGFVLKDGTSLTAGPDTVLAVDDYAFSPETDQYGLAARVSQGTVDFVSGLLGKAAPESVKVETPSGVIGIRGTHFVVNVGQTRSSTQWLEATNPHRGSDFGG
ncbi:MAG: hypothetical protein ACI8TX_000082 [Hyphomicrobiaceae bacterium]|jgi:hypothetical protein